MRKLLAFLFLIGFVFMLAVPVMALRQMNEDDVPHPRTVDIEE